MYLRCQVLRLQRSPCGFFEAMTSSVPYVTAVAGFTRWRIALAVDGLVR